jgi:two-component system, NtrC family, response regulator HydG
MKKTSWPRVVYCGTEDSLFKRLERHSEDLILEAKNINFRGSPQKLAQSKKASVLILRIKNEFELKHQEWLSRDDHSVPVIVLCQDGLLQTAIHALQYGVFDYFTSSQSVDVIISRIYDAITWRSLKPFKRTSETGNQILLGGHPEIRAINDRARSLARDSGPVLICGELGTGKEYLARSLHRLSRSRLKFVHYDCRVLQQVSRYDSLPVPELAQKRLTDLKKDHSDFFLFLNHTEYLSPDQAFELLDRSSRVSKKMVASFQGALSPSMTERMSARFPTVMIPALRKRREDIPAIVEYFVKNIARTRRLRQKNITQEMIRLMQEYSWPGNVKELFSSIDRMMLIEPSNTLTANSWRVAQGHGVQFQIEGANQFNAMIEEVLKNSEVSWASGSLYEDFMLKMKKMLIDLVLPRVDYNQATAARVLGISRNTLREILKSSDPIA